MFASMTSCAAALIGCSEETGPGVSPTDSAKHAPRARRLFDARGEEDQHVSTSPPTNVREGSSSTARRGLLAPRSPRGLRSSIEKAPHIARSSTVTAEKMNVPQATTNATLSSTSHLPGGCFFQVLAVAAARAWLTSRTARWSWPSSRTSGCLRLRRRSRGRGVPASILRERQPLATPRSRSPRRTATT